MGSLKESFTENAFNENAALARIRSRHAAERDALKARQKVWLSGGLAAAVLILLFTSLRLVMPGIGDKGTGTTSQPNSGRYTPFALAHAVVGVDINPSLELYIDDQDCVLGVQTLNPDAEQLDLSGLAGAPISEAVRRVIHLAGKAGFIDGDSEAENLVLVSTVILNVPIGAGSRGDDEQKLLDQKIGNGLRGQQKLDESVTVAVIPSTEQEMRAARQKGMALGVFIVNGLTDSHDRTVSIEEFAGSADGMEKLARRAAIVFAHTADSLNSPATRTEADGDRVQKPAVGKASDVQPGIPAETGARTGSGNPPQPTVQPEKKPLPSESRKPAPTPIATPSSIRPPAATGSPTPGATGGTTRTTEENDDGDELQENDDDQPDAERRVDD